jgi:hypothetical protein
VKAVGNGLACPKCGGLDLDVKDSRAANGMIRRRRRCTACSERFTTYEAAADDDERGSSLMRALDLRRKLDALPPNLRPLIEALIDRLKESHATEDHPDA